MIQTQCFNWPKEHIRSVGAEQRWIRTCDSAVPQLSLSPPLAGSHALNLCSVGFGFPTNTITSISIYCCLAFPYNRVFTLWWPAGRGRGTPGSAPSLMLCQDASKRYPLRIWAKLQGTFRSIHLINIMSLHHGHLLWMPRILQHFPRRPWCKQFLKPSQ